MTTQELTELSKSEDGSCQLSLMLAKLVGWHDIVSRDVGPMGFPPHGIRRVLDAGGTEHRQFLPNCDRSLEACHDVEMAIPSEKLGRWIRNLHEVVGPVPHGEEAASLIRATAPQRTIALILTMQES